jgi:hypothetical protein
MFDTIINKIRSLENTTLIIGGIGILLLVILLAYMTKRSKKQTVVEGEPQGQDCFGGVCQVPPHIKETLTQEEQVPMPVEPIVATEPSQPVQQPVQQPEEPEEQPESQPIEEQPEVMHQQEVQPEVVPQQINTEVLEEPMN